jgi:hypothetical protein
MRCMRQCYMCMCVFACIHAVHCMPTYLCVMCHACMCVFAVYALRACMHARVCTICVCVLTVCRAVCMCSCHVYVIAQSTRYAHFCILRKKTMPLEWPRSRDRPPPRYNTRANFVPLPAYAYAYVCVCARAMCTVCMHRPRVVTPRVTRQCVHACQCHVRMRAPCAYARVRIWSCHALHACAVCMYLRHALHASICTRARAPCVCARVPCVHVFMPRIACVHHVHVRACAPCACTVRA